MKHPSLPMLIDALRGSSSNEEKISILNKTSGVQRLSSLFLRYLNTLSSSHHMVLKQVAALEQLPCTTWDCSSEKIRVLADQLVLIDFFYQELGGIAGYQQQVLSLLHNTHSSQKNIQYHPPVTIDISKKTRTIQNLVKEGIRALPFFSEILPVGGAADRLHLIDERTGCALPAAKLRFAGHTLLEHIFRDLIAREWLCSRNTGKQVCTPVALMTSSEKENGLHVQEILENNQWFGRPREKFFFFEQPLVPVVHQSDGAWQWISPWELLLKPGGHGTIWKLAKDRGVFDWLHAHGAKYSFIRQINNPLAGLDYGLLALAGIGVSKKMAFGFSSCARLPDTAEGVNVLVEKTTEQGAVYSISNIEYCTLANHPLEKDPGFTANTNVLFSDLRALETAISRSPYPGLLLNFRNHLGRLESTMQNISDVFEEPHKCFPRKGLKTVFVTYNHRHKTISPAKKAFSNPLSAHETPENSFYDLMRAHRDLLTLCKVSLPKEKSLEETLSSYPSFSFLYHPTLGPEFSTIAKKIRGGVLGEGSELILENAETVLRAFSLMGSLQILAPEPTRNARCLLDRVTIENHGVLWEQSKPFWQGTPKRSESLIIELEGNSEFIAKNVRFHGSHHFVVKEGERITLRPYKDSFQVFRERKSDL